jgi:hypothetical protein
MLSLRSGRNNLSALVAVDAPVGQTNCQVHGARCVWVARRPLIRYMNHTTRTLMGRACIRGRCAKEKTPAKMGYLASYRL